MKIVTLGPKGTYSHEAVLKYFPDSEIVFADTIEGIIEAAEREKISGLIPIKNSTIGLIHETVKKLSESNLRIDEEVDLEINHCLLSKNDIDLDEIKKIYSHHHAINQCDNFIRENLPNAEVVYTNSTSEAALKVSNTEESGLASISPCLSAEEYGLNTIKEKVQDNSDNVTTFALVS